MSAQPLPRTGFAVPPGTVPHPLSRYRVVRLLLGGAPPVTAPIILLTGIVLVGLSTRFSMLRLSPGGDLFPGIATVPRVQYEALTPSFPDETLLLIVAAAITLFSSGRSSWLTYFARLATIGLGGLTLGIQLVGVRIMRRDVVESLWAGHITNGDPPSVPDVHIGPGAWVLVSGLILVTVSVLFLPVNGSTPTVLPMWTIRRHHPVADPPPRPQVGPPMDPHGNNPSLTVVPEPSVHRSPRVTPPAGRSPHEEPLSDSIYRRPESG